MSVQPGVIRNRAHATQIRDFSGLSFGRITPTDIDAFIEYSNKAFILIEGKHGGARMPRGQELALERLCDALHMAGKAAYLLVVGYTDPGDIDYAAATVDRCRFAGLWRDVPGVITLKNAVDRIMRKHGYKG